MAVFYVDNFSKMSFNRHPCRFARSQKTTLTGEDEVEEKNHTMKLITSLNIRRGSLSIAALGTLSILASASPQKAGRVPLPNSILPVISRSVQLIDFGRPGGMIDVSISLKPRDLKGLQSFADLVSDPKSDSYGQFITPVEVGKRFGATDKDINLVKAFFLTSGLKINHVGKNNVTVVGTGTKQQVESMFGTIISNMSVAEADKTVEYRSNVTALKVPSDLVSKIESIDGIETYTRPQRRGTTLSPAQTRQNYSLNIPYNVGWTGATRKLGISNWDGFGISNAALYLSHYGLPAPGGGAGSNIHVLPVGTGSQFGTPQGEGDLDFQMMLAICPLADIYIYDGTVNNLVAVLSREVSDNVVDIVSESYGWNVPVATANSAHTQHLSMTAIGMTYMAASGDSGTALGSFDYPDYDPEVLQVGGSIANTDAPGNRVTETAWTLSGGWGGGGGWANSANAQASPFNIRPSWQVGTGVPTVAVVNKRLVPDVAFHGSGAAGATIAAYQVYISGTLSGLLGTSASSPAFAAGLGNVEQRLYSTGGRGGNTNLGRLGRIQDRVYAQNGRSDVWFDITSGNIGNLPSSGSSGLNGTPANATVGWDFATGWGAMNFNTFYQTFYEAR